eukprot:gnl/TRDRNA2_/TRDRNA2_179780_c0_seq1.p1 gnl/TRDRNA2_/TRDRNA2_179780_c0~~gnl/TRDRNA2_/TRDRNA2_179780_c0_seq1.p1  ORF type:complete len:255 (-),score=63.11 gnl/TRDRNA2_/TRDRNA2_179780_c0_seq1:472-1236(-)
MMCSVSVITLLACVVLAHAKDPVNELNTMHNLVERMLKESHRSHADMDSTTLGKSGHLTISAKPSLFATPSRTRSFNIRQAPLLHVFPRGDSVSPWVSYGLQFPGKGTKRRHLQTRAERKEGYKFGDFTKGLFRKGKEALTNLGKEVTGDENYQIGDLSKAAGKKVKETVTEVVKDVTGNEDYQFGDITKHVVRRSVDDTKMLKKMADAAGKVMTEDEKYQFGDVTKGAMKRTKERMNEAGKAIADDIYDSHKN